MNTLRKLHALLVKVGEFLSCPLLLVIRLYWGWQFFLTGRGKLEHLEKTTSFFSSLNIPAPKFSAIVASSTECTCGLLLMLGLLTRFASPALITCMCVAYWTADHKAVVGIFSDPDSFTGAAPFLFLYASLILFAFGPGKISLDALIWKEKKP